MIQAQMVTDSDRQDGPYLHRRLVPTAAETKSLTSSALRSASFDPLGSKNIKLRLFFGAAVADTASIPDKTCSITVVGVPRKTGEETAQPKARTLLVLDCVCGTSKTQNTNPVTGATATGIDFYEADTITISKALTHYVVLDGTTDGTGGQNLEAVIEFDPLGMNIYCYFTTIVAGFIALGTPELNISLER